MPFDPELEKAVAFCKSANATTKTRDYFYSELRKFANRRREPGQSIESAFTKLITEDPDGRELYRAMKAAPMRSGSDIDGPPTAASRKPGGDDRLSRGGGVAYQPNQGKSKWRTF